MACGAMQPMKALLDDPEFGEPCTVCGNAEPIRRVAGGDVHAPSYFCEAAGAAFAKRYEAVEDREVDGSRGDDASDNDSDAGEEYGRDRGAKEKAAGGVLKMSDLLKDVNLYDLLGVSEGASHEEVKKAYRVLALNAHPDKQATMDAAKAKQIQERFVQIQEAYELLSDPVKRMQYDSSLDFDDSLPKSFKPGCGEDFYEVFGEAFRRNARFSSKRPVPDVGGPETKPDDWRRFYNFWHNFQSWRDPLVLAQKEGEELCDLSEAQCREEKRWMMRENTRVSKAYKQAERDRIAELVRLAEKSDPRILEEKEAKKAAREAEAARRAEEKLAVQRAKDEAERQRREAEEAARAVEAEQRRLAKAAKEVVREQVKKCRQRLRAFHPQVKHLVLLEQLNEVCLQLEEPALRSLGDEVQAALKNKKKGAAAAAAVFHRAIESIGLKPVQVIKSDDDTVSTSSGPSQSSQGEDPQAAEEQRRLQEEREQRAREAQARREAEEAANSEERVRREAEKAEERRKREEQRRKEQAQLDAKKRQQEKKEEDKAKKAAERAVKEEEQEVQKRQQQREEARQKAQEQAERDRQAATLQRQEQEEERVAQLFAADRIERLGKLDPMTDAALASALQQAVEADAVLSGALRLLRESSADAGSELALDRAMALLQRVGLVWPMGLAPPAAVRLPNAVRNRAKKARLRLRDVAAGFLSGNNFATADTSGVTEWQRGIADGSIEPPVWTPEDKEQEEKAAREAAAAKAAEAPARGKKAKKEPKETEAELDNLLAGLGELGGAGTSEAKKKQGKKKK